MSIKIKTFAALSCTVALSFGFASAAHAAGANAISVKDAWVRWLPNNLPAANCCLLDSQEFFISR